MESILTSIKKLLGITEADTSFDDDIIIHINSVFSILNQIGVGPSEGFSISDEHAIWNDFVSEESTAYSSVKTYVYLKVRLIFDPPSSSVVVDSIKRNLDELEWRLHLTAESNG